MLLGFRPQGLTINELRAARVGGGDVRVQGRLATSPHGPLALRITVNRLPMSIVPALGGPRP